MPFNSVVLSSTLLKAVAVYLMAIVAVEVITTQLYRAVRHVGITAWIVEHIGIPLARSAALLLFIFAAYPLLFGLSWAPPLSALLPDGGGRVRYLLNSAFFITLLLPMLPRVIARVQLILPLQGIAATALLFHWMAAAMGYSTVSYWPGTLSAVAIVGVGLVIGPIATAVGHHFGGIVDRLFERYDGEELLVDATTLLLQVPLLFIYTLALGRQLSGM